MEIFGICAFFLSCLPFFPICSGKSGFILTSPKVIDAGSTQYFALTLFDVTDDGNITLSLKKKANNDVIAQSVVSTSGESDVRIEMPVPPTSETEAILEIRGEFSGAYQTSRRKEVKIRSQSVITFVQTDKPVYKPGQTVKLRVFPLDSLLKPLKENTLADIWIEDPGKVRIAQWKNVNFSLGIVQLELPLSEEPVLGVYSIKTTINDVSHTEKFTVEEYVLPKFEVIIAPPSYIMADAENISTQICARYTYGKKVEGFLKATMKYKLRNPSEKAWFPSFSYEGMISGCQEFFVKSTDISLGDWSSRNIVISAEVTENGTEITQCANTTMAITRTPLEMTFLGVHGGNRYFKHGLPFYEKLWVTKPDKTPAAFEEIQICATAKRNSGASEKVRCKTSSTDREGKISFFIPAQSFSTNISVELKAIAKRYGGQGDHNAFLLRGNNMQRPKAEATLKPWYSPTESHLQIEPITEDLQCGQQALVRIRYTNRQSQSSSLTFYHQVISRGRIVHQGLHSHKFSVDRNRGRNQNDSLAIQLVEEDDGVSQTSVREQFGEFDLSFDVKATMSPIARLLVFYIRPDGEVVADSRKLSINQCFQNEASLKFRHERQYPSTDAFIELSASPLSFCGVGLVDKSVHLMQPEKQINKEKVFKLMQSYDLNAETTPTQTSTGHCRRYARRLSRPDFSVVDQEILDEYDPYFFRDVHGSYSLYVDTIVAFEDAGMVVMSDFELETRPCYIPRRRNCAYRSRASSHRGRARLYSSDRMRPEAVIWKTNDVFDEIDSEKPKEEPKSVSEIRSYFPETWLWELHTVRETGTVSFERTLPDTVTEWVGSAVCVNLETGLGISNTVRITAFQPFFISFTLPYSVIRNEIIPVVITVFNYLSECLPIKLSLEQSAEFEIMRESRNHKLCVCGGKSETHRFYIRPVALGEVNITVYGFSLEEDTICGNETTSRLSARDAVTRPLLVEAEGFPKEEVYNRFFCLNGSDANFSTEVDLMLPGNVVEGSARALLSLTGDLMGPTLDKLDSLVKLPMGCGEQNMVRFVPNIVVLDYLTAAGRITGDIKSKTISHMKTGYQRELRYRHSDGSYSAFGKSDKEGSMWLTAFVVRSFSQAKRFISIDENDLVLSTNWIVQHQLPNGCFPQVGTVLHSEMKGGLHRLNQSQAPLTAYVLMSLLEAGFSNRYVIRKATNCLRAHTNPSTYSLALYSYATALAKDSDTDDYLEKLESRAIREGSAMYWKYEGTTSRSVDIEIAAYAVLAMLEAEGLSSVSKVLPIVRWIAEQRNANGGFASTQDTVVALQALAKYASYISTNEVNIVTYVESDGQLHGFKIDDSNKLIMQIVKIPVVPTVVDFRASGVGCAMAQFTLRYNVESVQRSPAFDLGVTANGSYHCNEASIAICMRYKYRNQKSNMAVATAKMISGYVPDEKSLQKLQKDKKLGLRRHDVDKNEIHFYFDELTNKEKCFSFLVKNELGVENAKPATVKLYDYYQIESEVTEDYEIPSTCFATMVPP